MNNTFDVIVVGGGLAGLCNAIHLSKLGYEVLLIEKNAYPHHKVCGEYISNEVLPYLDFLDASPNSIGPVKITRFEITHQRGNRLTADLPLGGFGISRYTLDNFLFHKALENTTTFIQDLVEDISYQRDDTILVQTKNNGIYTTRFVIGAFGKRSNLDVRLNRSFFKQNAPWLGVKYHVKGNFPDDKVALHHFPGGYCGVSKIEDDKINICYLVDYRSFKKYKNLEDFQEAVMYSNISLKRILEEAQPLFERPLTISQIYFGQKPLIEDHIIMSGDSGGLIHPLCGNGMAMAIRSASFLSPLIHDFFGGRLSSRKEVEKRYTDQWNYSFKTRLKAGHYLQQLIIKDRISKMAWLAMKAIPSLLPNVIRMTHGTPIQIKNNTTC